MASELLVGNELAGHSETHSALRTQRETRKRNLTENWPLWQDTQLLRHVLLPWWVLVHKGPGGGLGTVLSP